MQQQLPFQCAHVLVCVPALGQEWSAKEEPWVPARVQDPALSDGADMSRRQDARQDADWYLFVRTLEPYYEYCMCGQGKVSM